MKTTNMMILLISAMMKIYHFDHYNRDVNNNHIYNYFIFQNCLISNLSLNRSHFRFERFFYLLTCLYYQKPQSGTARVRRAHIPPYTCSAGFSRTSLSAYASAPCFSAYISEPPRGRYSRLAIPLSNTKLFALAIKRANSFKINTDLSHLDQSIQVR